MVAQFRYCLNIIFLMIQSVITVAFNGTFLKVDKKIKITDLEKLFCSCLNKSVFSSFNRYMPFYYY